MKLIKIIIMILKELKRAKTIHAFPCDLIHQLAIMSEESGEAIQAGLNYVYGKGDKDKIITELIQTGAMCIRCLENIEIRKDKK